MYDRSMSNGANMIDPIGEYARGDKIIIDLRYSGKQSATISHFPSRTRVIVTCADGTLAVHRSLIVGKDQD